MTRLEIIASTMRLGGYYATGSWPRLEVLTAIRKFAVMSGDLELESQCDQQLIIERKAAGIPEGETPVFVRIPA